MNGEDAVDALDAGLELPGLIGGGHEFVDDEVYIGQLVCQLGEVGFVRTDFVAEIQLGGGP